MTQNTEHYKKLLEKELKLLEKDLKTVGRINPDNPKDWEATPPETDNMGIEPEENVYPMVPAGEAINKIIGGLA